MGKNDNIKSKLTKGELAKCNAIIHTASAAAAATGAGGAQIPLSDNAIITPIQITMIVALGKVFDQAIAKTAAKGLLATFATALVGRSISQILVGWVPGIGNVINASTAAVITEGVGWAAVKYFKYLSQDDDSEEKNDRKPDYKDVAETVSDTYIEKLEKQAEEFLEQKKNWEKQRDEYEALLDEFEKTLEIVEKLKDQLSRTEEENKRLLKFEGMYIALKNLPYAIPSKKAGDNLL